MSLHEIVLKKTQEVMEITNWKHVKSIQDIPVYTSDHAPMIVKGVGIINKSIDEMVKIICTVKAEERKKWEPLCQDIHLLQQGQDWQILNMTFNSPTMLVSGRNFLLFQKTWTQDDIVFISNTSIPEDHEHYQKEDPGLVRGWCHIGIWMLKKVEQCTELTSITQGEFRGWVPEYLTHQVKLDQPNVIIKMRQME